jgi:type IV secretion system protein VirB10
MTLVLIIAAVGFVLYSFLGGDDKESKKNSDEPKKIASGNDVQAPPPPPPPTPPEVPAPTTPTLPPVPPPPPDVPAFEAPTDLREDNGGANAPAETDEQRLQRLKSPMLIIGSDTGLDTKEAERARAEDSLASGDPNLAFSRDAIAASDTRKAIATSIGNLRTTIAQGKIIDAVLETAINTDLPGTLRAIISRDVYAEAGKEPVIPKGSRLIGAYNTGILRGQKRVFIIWTRVIRPDGVDIKIASPGVDALGRAGLPGFVDNKFMEQFSAAILTSAMSIGIAYAAGNEDTTTTTSPEGSTTTQGSAGALATQEAVRSLGQVGADIVKKTLDLRPTITVNQGTRVSVMVNRDLIFPADTAHEAHFVQ